MLQTLDVERCKRCLASCVEEAVCTMVALIGGSFLVMGLVCLRSMNTEFVSVSQEVKSGVQPAETVYPSDASP